MKKIQILVKSILEGTLKVKLVAGAAVITIATGVGVGTVYAVKHHQEQVAIEERMNFLKEDLQKSIEAFEYQLSQLPEGEDTKDLQDGLKVLKGYDLDTMSSDDLENTAVLIDEMTLELNEITQKYVKEMNDYRKELNGLDTSKFDEKQLKAFTDARGAYSNLVDSCEYKTYENKYKEVKKLYDDTLKAIEVAEKEAEEKKAQEEAEKRAQEEAAQLAQAEQEAQQSYEEPVYQENNSGSSNSGSSNSGSSNSGSSNSGSSQAPAPQAPSVQEPVVEQAPAAPSIPSGSKSDIAAQVVSYASNMNTNVTDGEDASMSPEHYNYLYGIAQQLANGSISGSTAISQMKAKSFDFFGILTQTVTSATAGRINVSGCDFDSIVNAIESQIGLGGVHFVYCDVYYDGGSNTSTVTYIGADVR